ncbi:MAG: Sir2 family NAD-dependent protein deacetylase [Desulfobacteraceae bacterium]|jgi:NAD-dependent SIR2 family protein deacetylase
MPGYSGDQIIEIIAHSIKTSERILVGGGAGLSASVGIDYTDSDTFSKLFPRWVEKGYRMQYEFIGFENWTEGERWAYWATHMNHVFFEFPPSPEYQKLHEIVKNRDYYVITSNADGMFIKSGFDPDRVFQAQGNYERLMCMEHCTGETWHAKPFIDNAIANIDHETFSVKDFAIPLCPKCGGKMTVAFRMREDYGQWAEKYQNWINGIMDKKLTVMEFGVGFNTPGVIRRPFEYLVYSHNDVLFVRVNRPYQNYANTGHPQIPAQIKEKSISVNGDAAEFINRLHKYIRQYK